MGRASGWPVCCVPHQHCLTQLTLQDLFIKGNRAFRPMCSAAGVSSGCGAITKRAATMLVTSAAACIPTRAASSCSCPQMWSPRTGIGDQCSPPSSQATSLVSALLPRHLYAVVMHTSSCKSGAGLMGHHGREEAAKSPRQGTLASYELTWEVSQVPYRQLQYGLSLLHSFGFTVPDTAAHAQASTRAGETPQKPGTASPW